MEIVALFITGLSIGIYFVPTIVALNREHHNKIAIVVLNVFAGWTLIGWVGALVWALTNPPRRDAVPPPLPRQAIGLKGNVT